ncbi:MAG: LytTR family DNA-binding domain-containing protein [Saprospiraceae bacterium]|nr:LytTR family DNA-binding domain-containing protein [Saprospiraceae bacterium]
MQILIIEDEPRAANQLQQMLQQCNFKYDLLGIIDSVEEAISWLSSNKNPDLVFMDIQLADGLSFEIFQKVNVTAPIIFTTAFDQYAIRAFKVNSIDYLLKPIQQEDLQVALNKFLQSNVFNPYSKELFTQLLHSMQGSTQRQGILVKKGSSFIQLPIADVLYFYSEESITFGVTTQNKFIIDETLDQLFASLDRTAFYRINRGQIVAKAAIEKFESYFNHRVKLAVSHARQQEFIVSRQKTSEFKHWMNQ